MGKKATVSVIKIGMYITCVYHKKTEIFGKQLDVHLILVNITTALDKELMLLVMFAYRELLWRISTFASLCQAEFHKLPVRVVSQDNLEFWQVGADFQPRTVMLHFLQVVKQRVE